MHSPMPLSSIRSDIPSDVDRVIMKALATNPNERPATVREWIEELEAAAEDVSDKDKTGSIRVVVMGPPASEIYVDDERKGSIGSSGRVVLSDVPAGRHVLRVSRAGERDDERVIEVRPGGPEQVIQAALRPALGSTSEPSPSHGAGTSGSPASSLIPGIVACRNCHARFAEGAKFCGRCGGNAFDLIVPGRTIRTSPCPRCGIPLPENSKFCGRCGAHISPGGTLPASYGSNTATFENRSPQMPERICTRCGTAYPPHIKFCGRCGNGL